MVVICPGSGNLPFGSPANPTLPRGGQVTDLSGELVRFSTFLSLCELRDFLYWLSIGSWLRVRTFVLLCMRDGYGNEDADPRGGQQSLLDIVGLGRGGARRVLTRGLGGIGASRRLLP